MRFSQKHTTELHLENYIVNEYMKDHIFEYPLRARLFRALARNCLAHTLDYIVMQMWKTNREQGYFGEKYEFIIVIAVTHTT